MGKKSHASGKKAMAKGKVLRMKGKMQVVRRGKQTHLLSPQDLLKHNKNKTKWTNQNKQGKKKNKGNKQSRDAKEPEEFRVVLPGDNQPQVSINEDDAFFSSKLNLVPVEMYIAPEEGDDPNLHINTKFAKNLKQSAPKQQVKEMTKKAQKRRKKFGEAAEEDVSNAKALESIVRQQEEEKRKQLSESSEKNHQQTKGPAKNIDELRARLATKIKESKGGRKDMEDKKRMSKQEEKQLKKQKKKEQKKARQDAAARLGGETEEKDDPERQLRETVTKSILAVGNKKKQPKESFSFGLMTGVEEQTEEDPKARVERLLKKRGGGRNNILSVKKMLQNAEENQALIKELKSSSNPEDRKVAEEKEWDAMEKKALGEKVLGPKQLKKAVKDLERKKRKSTREWAARTQAVEDSKKERLDKRDENIKTAQRKKVENKLKRKGIVLDNGEEEGSRRRQKRAGFEGKHQGFLNDEEKNKKNKDKGSEKKDKKQQKA